MSYSIKCGYSVEFGNRNQRCALELQSLRGAKSDVAKIER